jgi:general nucleoside transport system ATP-binding protein
MRVELRGIDKSFGPVHANADISLAIPAGTIQGVLGENGAGKSTLMKVLSGFMRADAGEILLDDKVVVIDSPADAIRVGVGMLHQDPLDFPPMRVLDNFLIGPGQPMAPGKRSPAVFPDRAGARTSLVELTDQFGFSLDPDAQVDTLTVGERQQLELVRLLWLGARVLILDEPTTGISAPQREKLFAVLRHLALEGKTVIFVSHKLDEVERLCHRVAVLRQGRLVDQTKAPYQTEKLVQMMFNRIVAQAPRCEGAHGSTAFALQDLAVEDRRMHVGGFSLDVKQGEVIGFAGMEGSGQALLMAACAGLMRSVSGRILLGDYDLTGKPYRTFLHQGVAYVPAARLEEGLVPGLTLTEHFLLAQTERGFFIDWDKGDTLAGRRIKEFNIRGTPSSPIESLSGGNQQRALLALVKTPVKLLLLEHPTRGLDVESTIYLWAKMKERCQQDTAIIFISSDLDELLQYSDRILVFFSGRVSEPREAGATDSETLGQLIGGKGFAQEETDV